MSTKKGFLAVQVVIVIAVVALLTWSAAAATVSTPRKTAKSKSLVENSKAQKKIGGKRRHRRVSKYVWVNGHRLRRNRYPEHYKSASFVTEDLTVGDITAGE